MKGYFSQLARSSGLSFGPAGSTAGNNVARPTKTSAAGVSNLASLDVHEVVVAPPAPSVAEVSESNQKENLQVGVSTSPDVGGLSVHAEPRPSFEEAKTQQESNDARPTAASIHESSETILLTESEDSKSHLPSQFPVQFIDSFAETPGAQDDSGAEPVSDQQKQVSSEASVATLHAGTTTRLVDKLETTGSELAAGDFPLIEQPIHTRPGRQPETPDEEHSQAALERHDSTPDKQSEAQLLVRNYLKEVRAWVAMPPEPIEDSAEADIGLEGYYDRSDVFSPGPAPDTSRVAPVLPAEAPAVQDLSLSIGSISIVVEEPQKNMPAPVATQPRAEGSMPRGDRESTNLSRYYLRTW
jgi:hypothetical protein